MNVLIIDGQGGQLGAQFIKGLKNQCKGLYIMAVGTNSIATAAMLKAGADQGATGENPVVVACRKADIIVGPIGIVEADSLFGEITPKMAMTVGAAEATRIFLPIAKCDNYVAGTSALSMQAIIEDAIQKVKSVINQNTCE